MVFFYVIFHFAFKWARACHHGFYGKLFREFTYDLEKEQRHLGGDKPSGEDEVVCLLGCGFLSACFKWNAHQFDVFGIYSMIDEVLAAVGSDDDIAVKTSENEETEHSAEW